MVAREEGWKEAEIDEGDHEVQTSSYEIQKALDIVQHGE